MPWRHLLQQVAGGGKRTASFRLPAAPMKECAQVVAEYVLEQDCQFQMSRGHPTQVVGTGLAEFREPRPVCPNDGWQFHLRPIKRRSYFIRLNCYKFWRSC